MKDDRDDREGRAKNADSLSDEGARGPDKIASKTPDLLPKGFRPATRPGKFARVGAVEVARAERDDGVRKRERVRRKRRNDSRAKQRKTDERVSRIERSTMGLIAFVVLAAPLMIGSVHLVTIVPLAAISVLAAAMAMLVCHLRGTPFKAGVLGWALTVLTAYTFIQAIPLPFGLVETLSPTIGQWIATAYGSTQGGPPDWATLGLTPGIGTRAGFGLLAALGLYLATFNLFQEKEKFQRAMLLVPAVAVVLVLIGVLQKVLAAEGLLFFYKPRDLDALPFFSATFVNPNHLGTLLGLSSFVPLSLSLSKDFKPQRGMLVLLFGICVSGMVMTLSAAALLSWVLGLLTYGLLTLRRRFTSRQGATIGVLSVIGALGIGAYAAWTQLADRVAFLSKQQGVLWSEPSLLWSEGWRLAQDHLWLGIGRGGFYDAFATMEHPALPGRYGYINNTYLQTVIDYGLPLGLLAILVIGGSVVSLGLRRGWKKEDLPLMTGLFAAFVFLGLDAALGFSLEIPGVLLPTIFLLALARGRDARYQAQRMRKPRRRRRSEESEEDDAPQPEPSPAHTPSLLRTATPIIGLAVAALLGVIALPTAVDTATGGPNNTLRALVSQDKPDIVEINAAARDAIARTPIHSPTHMSAAVGYAAAGDSGQAAEALKRAQAFNRSDPAPWLMEARDHIDHGRKTEGKDTYRKALELALRTQGTGRDAIALEIAQVFRTPTDVAEAMPADASVWTHLLRKLLGRGQAGRVIALCEALLVRFADHPDSSALRTVQAQAEAALGRWPQARALALTLQDSPHGAATAWLILAQADLAQERPAEALSNAGKGLRAHPRDIDLHFLAAEIRLEHKQTLGFDKEEALWRQAIDGHLRVLRPTAIQRNGPRYRFYRLSGLYAMDRGQAPNAIRDLNRAMEANPDDPEVMIHTARLLRSERRFVEAVELHKRFLERFPDHPQAAAIKHDLDKLKTLQNRRNPGAPKR